MSYLIKNGWMLNEQGEKVAQDIRVTGEFITETGLLTAKDGETVIDAEGLFVSPGLVDLHVHFREPGGEKKKPLRRALKPRRGRLYHSRSHAEYKAGAGYERADGMAAKPDQRNLICQGPSLRINYDQTNRRRNDRF